MGSITVSVDAELGWGYRDVDRPPTDRIESARSGWLRLLDLFDRYEIPATWAIVGHLFLDDCDGEHADHPSPNGWFARERGEWQARPDIRFGGGLVEAVVESSVDHEIACHTFSHVEFGAPETDRKLARAEVDASLAAARNYGIDMRSFVFPRNNVGHLDVLAETSFTTFRGRSPIAPSPPFRPLRKLSQIFADQSFLVKPQIEEHGLVNVPASLFLFGFEGAMRSAVEPIVGDSIVRQARRGIDQATHSDGVFHVYLHPNDLVTERDVRRVETILSAIDERRRKSSLTVETMQEVGDRVLNSRTATTGQRMRQ